MTNAALYRAVYQAPPPSSRIRGMTFAAASAQDAGRIAEDWQIRDRLLVVKQLRPLARPLLELAP
jgi:hypothetical protein